MSPIRYQPLRRRLHFELLEDRRLLSVTGDYSGNGAVDAADYVVWRKTLGSDLLLADGNGDTMVDSLDHVVWREHFGEAVPAPGPFQITGPGHLLLEEDFIVTWEAAEGATSYELNMSDYIDGSLPFLTETLSTTSRVFTGVGERTVYVFVKAINAGGETLGSNGMYEITISIPDPQQVLFVTSQLFFIDPFDNYPPSFNEIGSAAAADYSVTNLANQAGLLAEPWDGVTILFRALVTETLLPLQTRANLGDVPFFNTRGEVIAYDLADLFDGSLSAAILDQNGNPIVHSNLNVWTGANADGSSSGLTANDWSSWSGTATVGRATSLDSNWVSFGTRAGNLSARLYGVGDTFFVFGQPSADVPKNVSDNSTIVSQIEISGAATIADVNVQLSITHGSTDDLSAFLVSPTGTRVELFSNEGGNTGYNFDETIFNDEAVNSVTTADSPFLGHLRPEALLSAFDGENPNGVWTLEISDNAIGTEGILRGWSLQLNSPVSGAASAASPLTSLGVSQPESSMLAGFYAESTAAESAPSPYRAAPTSVAPREIDALIWLSTLIDDREDDESMPPISDESATPDTTEFVDATFASLEIGSGSYVVYVLKASEETRANPPALA